MTQIDQIELNNLKHKAENALQENVGLKKQRTILAIVSAILLLLFLSCIIYFSTTSITQNNLEEKGLTLISSEEYKTLIDFKHGIAEQKQLEAEEKEELANLETEDEPEITETAQPSIDDQIIYAIQIGALDEKSISLYTDSFPQFREFYTDEFYKYTLGAFESLEEAQIFRKEVLQMGFEDAFIGSYKNGKRIRIEEAY
ncbi:hypothetical protein [Aquimarina agarilytica]|uniref:hypothetical protein n=1 Tax=Aquimarina agarilytica TaxID=1087449 RepID=UPI00028804D6|nr:hypothetical protein [Aquimarina agarilytica]